MRHQGFFLVFIMCLTLGLSLSYRAFQDHFSDRKELGREIVVLKKLNEKNELRQALLMGQIEDLQAMAFKSLGQKTYLAWDQKQWMNSMRSPASVRSLGEEIGSANLLIEAKKEFRADNYKAAASKFRQVIEKYPVSKDIIETHFLLAESLFLSGQIDASMDLVDEMMTRYPDSELTGFIMLRMGQVLEKKNRQDEALEVYQAVFRQFPKSPALLAQIEARVKGMRKIQ